MTAANIPSRRSPPSSPCPAAPSTATSTRPPSALGPAHKRLRRHRRAVGQRARISEPAIPDLPELRTRAHHSGGSHHPAGRSGRHLAQYRPRPARAAPPPPALPPLPTPQPRARHRLRGVRRRTHPHRRPRHRGHRRRYSTGIRATVVDRRRLATHPPAAVPRPPNAARVLKPPPSTDGPERGRDSKAVNDNN